MYIFSPITITYVCSECGSEDIEYFKEVNVVETPYSSFQGYEGHRCRNCGHEKEIERPTYSYADNNDVYSQSSDALEEDKVIEI